MAKYREIKGVTVQTRDEDPSLFVGSWASGGNVNTARETVAGNGIQTAALMTGGSTPGGKSALTESYDGSSWTETGDLNTARSQLRSEGSYTATIAFGGVTTAVSALNESFNGSSWTETGDLNTARRGLASAGASNTAVLAITGLSTGPTTNVANMESWDGSSWTETTDVNTARRNLTGGGPNTSALIFGGYTTAYTNLTESWNGSAWTETGDMNTNRIYHGGDAASNTSAIAFAGDVPPMTANTETWDGSTWTEVNNLSQARNGLADAGNATTALASSGSDGSSTFYTNTEEWSFPSSPVLNEGDLFLSGGTTLKGFGKAAGIPAATWASGGAVNTGRINMFGVGSSTSDGLIYGGESPYHALTEKYNGTSWTEVADLATARQNGGSVGTTGAAGAISGLATPGYILNFEQFDGSSWSEAADVNAGRQQGNGAGTNTAALFFTGYRDSPNAVTSLNESWNGSAWTESGDLNTARTTSGGGGTQTLAISCGGATGPTSAQSNNTELWDGSAWTEVNNLNTSRYAISQGAGSQSQFLIYGGISPPTYTTNTELFNGTSWTEVNNLSAARGYQSQTGQAISALSSSGNGPTTATEEFDADATLSTVTVS